MQALPNVIGMHGTTSPARDVLIYADSIKLDNYKTATIKQFQRRFPVLEGLQRLLLEIAILTGVHQDQLEPVFFSVCKGAEAHTDDLDRNIYIDTTIVVPLVVPPGVNVFYAGEAAEFFKQFHVYSFNHTVPHELILGDTDSGCTVLMVAIKKC